MFIAEKMIGNPIYHADTGNRVGSLKDIYLDANLHLITGLYVGSEGVLNRAPMFIPRSAIRVMGEDSILVTSSPETDDFPETWIRRDRLSGREIETNGGTKIGRVGDVVLDSHAHVAGFTLDWSFVNGPLAERGAFGRTAVIDTGETSEHMTIDLDRAERQDLAVESHLFQTDEVITSANGSKDERETSETQTDPKPLVYLRDEKGTKSPPIPDEMQPA